jgi:tetratricopeptide (TPR) repeat protein
MSYSLTSVGVSNFHTAYNGDAASVQPDAPSHESQVTTDSMPMLGISMVGIDEFIGRCGGEACLEGLETAQVCEKFIVPMTIETKSSYVEYIDGCAARRRVPCLQLVSRANLFISHAWRYKFLAVVSALRQFLASNKNKQGTPETVYVWFDLFTNSQHESTCVIRPFSWWSGTFLNAIKSIGWLLLVLEPSDNPVIFTRVWCIWELYCAYVSGCRIDAGMSEAELGRFHRRILLDSQSCDWDFDQERSNFFAMVAHIDIRAADAMRPSDKAQIFAVIEGTVGFHALNSTVTDCLRQWVIADFQRTMESIDSSSGTNCELYEEQKQDLKNMLDVRRKNRVPVDASMLHYKQALANLYRQVGNYNAAVELLEKCQRGYETYEVGDIQDVARVMACRLRLAECYCMLGRPRRAAELLKSINVDSGVTLGGSLLLHCLVRTADPAYLAEADRLAISMVQDQLGSKALRDWAELPALTSVPAIHSCIQLAEVHVAQGRVDDAQSVLTHVLASAEGVFRDSVDVSVNLIESFYPWPSDKCHKSSKLVLPVAARCIRPCIVRAIHLLAHVSMTKKDFRKAVALNGFIAELCREKFGGNHPDTLTAVSNLAVSYFCLGLDMKCEDETSLDARNVFEQAEELLRLCHARRATVFGSAHAICLSTLNNVAVVVRHLGRPKEAEDLLMEALQARPSAEGKYPAAESVDVDHLICRYNWTAVRLRNIDLRVQHPKNRARDSRVLEDCTADLRPILQDFMMLLSASHPAILQMKSQLACVLVLRTATRKEGSELFADLLRSLEAAATDSTKAAQSGEAVHISGTVQSLGTKTTLIPPFLTQSWSSDTRCLSSSCLLMDTEISRTETRLVERACALRLTVTCLQSGDIGLLAPCAHRLLQLVKSTATICFGRSDCRTSQIVVMAALVGAIAFDSLQIYSQATAILQAGLSYIEAMPTSFNHANSGRHSCIYARFVILLELVRLHFMMGNIGHAIVDNYWAALAAISTNETSLHAESSVTQQYRALSRHRASVKESQQPLERVRSVSRAISACWLQSTSFVSVAGGFVGDEDRGVQASGCCCVGASAPASNVDANFLSRHVDLGSVFRFWEEGTQFIVDDRDCAETKSPYLRSHGITDGSPPRGGSCCRLLSCCVCCCPCVLSCWVLLWQARVSVGLSGPHAAIEPS